MEAFRCVGDSGGQPMHLHEGVELVAVPRGRGRLRVGPRRFDTGPGLLVVVPPGETHGGAPLDPQFTVEVVNAPSALLERLGLAIDVPATGDDVSLRAFRSLFDAVANGASRLAQEEALAGVCDALSPLMPLRDRAVVDRARTILRARYAEDLSLAELAQEVGVDAAYLCRAYREATGLPPHATRNALRVARAHTLIREGWSVGEAAAEVGFCDQSHLTRRYVRLMGRLPSSARSISSKADRDAGE